MNVVIVGRPNVGKSSLFNRLLGKKRSLVLDVSGVTRDRIVEPITWWVGGKEYRFNLIDTGGLGPGNFAEEIKQQVKTALEEASLVLWVMDIRAGLTTGDREVHHELRKAGVTERMPVIGILNKSDSDLLDEEMNEFYKIGLEQMIPLSAEHDLGIEDLKDLLVQTAAFQGARVKRNDADGDDADEVNADGGSVPDAPEVKTRAPRIPNVAIIGQPNVGKSTLLNAISGETRSIVSNIAGTTVDSIDTKINWHGKEMVLIDTAGIRRKDKTEQGIEVLSVVQSKKTLERADIALLMMDAEKGVYDQDEKIAGLIEDAGCSVILVLNKWDLQEQNADFSQKEAEKMLREKIRFLGYAPLVFLTAKDGIGLDRLFRMIQYVLEQRWVKVPTRDLTDFFKTESEIHNPGNAKFYMTHQTGRNPPTFVSHVNDPRKIHFSLSRHMVKAIRERWGFLGTPIRLSFTKTKNSGEKSEK